MPLGAKVEKNEKVANKGDRINAVKMRMPVYNSLVNSIVGNSGKVDDISYYQSRPQNHRYFFFVARRTIDSRCAFLGGQSVYSTQIQQIFERQESF